MSIADDIDAMTTGDIRACFEACREDLEQEFGMWPLAFFEDEESVGVTFPVISCDGPMPTDIRCSVPRVALEKYRGTTHDFFRRMVGERMQLLIEFNI